MAAVRARPALPNPKISAAPAPVAHVYCPGPTEINATGATQLQSVASTAAPGKVGRASRHQPQRPAKQVVGSSALSLMVVTRVLRAQPKFSNLTVTGIQALAAHAYWAVPTEMSATGAIHLNNVGSAAALGGARAMYRHQPRHLAVADAGSDAEPDTEDAGTKIRLPS